MYNNYIGDTLKMDIGKQWNLKGFDAVIGNPPYNKERKNTSASPLYHLFIDKYIDLTQYLLFVVPSRWFATGKGLDKFRANMLKRDDILLIRHFEDASILFKKTDIKGGVNYFLKDKLYHGLCDFNGKMKNLSEFDVLVGGDYMSIIKKIDSKPNFSQIYNGQYRIESNDKRLMDRPTPSSLKCYVSKQKGFIKYIEAEYVNKVKYSTYKIITTSVAHKALSGFGNMFIGYPGEVHTRSYISFNVPTELEAKSLLSYLQSRLPNFLLSIRKRSQGINRLTIQWIPLPPLDRLWTNDSVYQYYQLTPQEINMIKQTPIVGYKEAKI